MPDATTSVTRICLRCEAHLLLRSNFFYFPPSRPFTFPRPLSTTRSISSTVQHGQEPSRLAKWPRQTRHPFGKLHGRRGRELREEIASLDSISLGTPSKIVVLRDANLDYSKDVMNRDQNIPEGKEYASAKELLEAVSVAKRFIGVDQVKANLESLRPKSNDSLLSQAECNELASKVREGFTNAQLARYMQDIDKTKKLGSRRTATQDSILPGDKIGQTEWKLGLLPGLSQSDTFPTSVSFRKLPRKDQLVMRLFKDYWKIQIREDVESIGQLELGLLPLEMSLLLGDSE